MTSHSGRALLRAARLWGRRALADASPQHIAGTPAATAWAASAAGSCARGAGMPSSSGTLLTSLWATTTIIISSSSRGGLAALAPRRAFATLGARRATPWRAARPQPPTPQPQPRGPRLPPRRALSGASAGGESSNAAGGQPRSPITFNSMLIGVAAFLGVVAVAQHKAQERVDDMMRRSQQVVGKAAVGGPFALVDQDGKPFTHLNLLGHWSVLYFGFTHCPDICPDELEKLAEAIDLVERDHKTQIQPVFITIDPARDGPKKVKEYVREFHPRLIGLTGSEEAIKSVSKAYRVYFHKTTDDPDDYLVDHSIITYLIDPNGEFVTFYGKNFDAPGLAASIGGHIQQFAEAEGAAAAGAAPKAAAKGQAGSQEGRAQR